MMGVANRIWRIAGFGSLLHGDHYPERRRPDVTPGGGGAAHTDTHASSYSPALLLCLTQVLLDWFITTTTYTYVAYLPAYFRSTGISAVTTQVRPSRRG
jgi:hypothetical protein